MAVFFVTVGATGGAQSFRYYVDAGNEGVAITRAIQKDRRKFPHPQVMLISCARTKLKREDVPMQMKGCIALDANGGAEQRLADRGDILQAYEDRHGNQKKTA